MSKDLLQQKTVQVQRYAQRVFDSIAPTNADELHHVLKKVLDIHVPRMPLLPGSDAPFDYLVHTFFEGRCASDAMAGGDAGCVSSAEPQPDCIVWANRGGGKTYLGAVATMLDMVYKPGIAICILGGSFEQSSKMYDYLRGLFTKPRLYALLDGKPTQKHIRLVNGSSVQILPQSQRSVRGQRIQRLRCDEVDEFDEEVWKAAQFVTRSAQCGSRHVAGGIESLSTMHQPMGMMQQLVEKSQATGEPRLFRWTVMDVISRCEPTRSCEGCVLWSACHGKARQADGFLPVADAVQQYKRSDQASWESEMMCDSPNLDDLVYANFDVSRHVTPVRGSLNHAAGQAHIVLGMDFGFRGATAVLWANVIGRGEDAIVQIFDEYVKKGQVTHANIEQMNARPWPRANWIAADPAGNHTNNQTGISDIQLLRKMGYCVRTKGSGVIDGVKRIRRRFDRCTLFIDPHCRQLIAALQQYHFDLKRKENPRPVKDGPDHVCDALRYLIVNLENNGELQLRRYTQ